MGIFGQSINLAASLAFADLFKKKKVPEKKNFEQRPKLMHNLKEPATIGNLKCDVIIDKEISFDSEVTENPVEDGFAVADHVSRKPINLKITVLFTPTPVTHYEKEKNYQNRLNEVLTELQKIYKKGEPVKITTVDAIYKDMLMITAPLPRNVENGYCYSAQLSFVQVRRVSQKTEALPNSSSKGKNGATETDAGQAAQDEIGVETVENTSQKQVNVAIIAKGQGGNFSTGLEQKSKIVKNSLLNTLKRSAINTVINKIGSKVVGKSSMIGKLSKVSGGWL